MCGIIGYYGLKNTKKILFEGLKTLEYRGYDSAGVCIWHKDSFKRIRAKGNLDQLNKKLKNLNLNGPLGIGHIRWATHGKPSAINAHPHTIRGISIVHNGIIENDLDLKEKLSEKGASFRSETDSELLAHLISEKFLMQKKNTQRRLLQSVLGTIPLIQGNYSVLAVSKDHPNEIIAFKKGLPLILGQTKHLIMIASDVKALLPYTKNIFYLEDDEIALIQGLKFKLFNLQGKEIKNIFQKKVKIRENLEKIEKLNFSHFMLKEIFEQPKKIENLLRLNSSSDFKKINLKDLKKKNPFSKKEKIFIVACGSSFYAALIGKHLIEKHLEIPVEVDIASEFRYRNLLAYKNALVLLISQSGETADTLAALKKAQQKGMETLGICNEKHSSLARAVHECLYLEAGTERAVASTKSFMNTSTLFYLLSTKFRKDKKLLIEEESILRSLKKLTFQMEGLSQQCFDFFSKNIKFFNTQKGFFFIGRGPHYPIALEGALKIKELAYRYAEGYPAGELKHGPLALIDPSLLTVALCPKDFYYEKTLNNLIEIKARKGKLLAIGTEKDTQLQKLSDFFIPLPKVEDSLYPLIEMIPLQLLAYSLAKFLGHDVDRPRNLAKSVTVE